MEVVFDALDHIARHLGTRYCRLRLQSRASHSQRIQEYLHERRYTLQAIRADAVSVLTPRRKDHLLAARTDLQTVSDASPDPLDP